MSIFMSNIYSFEYRVTKDDYNNITYAISFI